VSGGYGKPPKEHRFKPGQSGNPKGRPKAKNRLRRRTLDPVHAKIWDIINEPVPVLKNGSMKKMPGLDAFFRKLKADALQGRVSSQRFVMQVLKDMGKDAAANSLASFRAVEEYERYWGPIFAAARESGRPEPDQLPHPDHVDFDLDFENMDLVVTGPETKAEQIQWEAVKAYLRRLDERRCDLNEQIAGLGGSDELRFQLRQIKKEMRSIEKKLRPGWNWRECVTDADRAYYDDLARRLRARSTRK
jgi:hypothetical protein